MYLPSPFNEARIPVLHDLMRSAPLATLITLDAGGMVANHIPLQVVSAPQPHGALHGHVARANPLWRQHPPDKEALAVFQGPHAYVSPSYYPTKRLTGEVVPTWNYAVVHVYGTLRFIHDPHQLLQLVSSLTEAHETARPAPWQVTDAPSGYIEKMLGSIVGFEFSIIRMFGKWKASQNRNAADRQGVIDGLRSADGASQAVAGLVEQATTRSSP